MKFAQLKFQMFLFETLMIALMTPAAIAETPAQCPPSERIVNGMPINYQHCTTMPTMQGCPEFIKEYEACRPPRRKIELSDLLDFPESEPGIEEQEKLGFCIGDTVTRAGHRIYKLVVEESTPETKGRAKNTGDYKFIYSYLNQNNKNGQACRVSPVYHNKEIPYRSINAPNLFFKKGEIADIEVENRSTEKITIHWHGILLSNGMDGVPNVTQKLIEPGSTYKYSFELKQEGTYWYHPHSDMHEQQLRGGIVIYDVEEDPVFQEDKTKYHHDRVVLMNDFKAEDPNKVLNRLILGMNQYSQESENYTDLYTATKTSGLYGFMQYFKNIKNMGMPNMDKSDVWYSSFFVNDSNNENYPFFIKPGKGERVRLRLINGSASSYLYVNYANEMDSRYDPVNTTPEDKKEMEARKLTMTIIAKDGRTVVPVETDQILMGMGETYDVLVDIPDPKTAYELLVKSYDDLRSERLARVYLGAPTDVFSTKVVHGRNVPVFLWGHGVDDGIYTQVNYSQLKSLMNTGIPKDRNGNTKDLEQFNLRLNGDMETYKWQILSDKKADKKMSLNSTHKYDSTLKYDSDNMPYLVIPTGKRVRMNFTNTMVEGMMNHPMHLHGNFFRVVQSPDQKPEEIWQSAEMHTANVFPDQTLSLEFDVPTKEEDPSSQGCWMLHCHNLYHMANSMMMYVVTEGSTCPAMPMKDHASHEHAKNNKSVSSMSLSALNPMSLKGQIIQFLGGAGVSKNGMIQTVGFNGAASNGNKGHLYFKGRLNHTTPVFAGDQIEKWDAEGETSYCISRAHCVKLILKHSSDKPKGDPRDQKLTAYVGASYQYYFNPLLSTLQFNAGVGAQTKYGSDIATSVRPALMLETNLRFPILPNTMGELSVGCEGEYCNEFTAKLSGENRISHLVLEPEIGYSTDEDLSGTQNENENGGFYGIFRVTVITDPM
jgi:FtsP/CotA-like multicopper oxidase with cupredoxin domain